MLLHLKEQKSMHQLEVKYFFSGEETGEADYGGFIVLQHTGNFETFYSLYGHLDAQTLLKKGETVQAGVVLGKIRNYENNGGWYPHLHLQIITQKGIDEGYLHRGYCNQHELVGMNELCPNPEFLFTW